MPYPHPHTPIGYVGIVALSYSARLEALQCGDRHYIVKPLFFVANPWDSEQVPLIWASKL